MALDILSECTFTGPALPEPFVQFELEKELNKAKVLPKTTGKEGKALRDSWEVYRRKLRELAVRGGPVRVRNHVIEPLLGRLGYDRIEDGAEIETREGRESGGYVMVNGKARLRTWTTSFEEDLDAPARRGATYRYSHVRIAQRVLLATGEQSGLLTNGVELRVLISDPARPDSQVLIPIDPFWKRSREVPNSFRLILALVCPEGLGVIPKLVDKARLQQTRVTGELRVQARQAIELFIQDVLDHPANQEKLSRHIDKQALAKALWHEGLITIYRLLFILKLESGDDPARSFSFASTSLWRNTFSPSIALARFVRSILDEGAETGNLLEEGVRNLYKMFAEGLQCTELNIQPLGGALFGAGATPTLSVLHWGEQAVAHLLDRLLWTPRRKGSDTRERVHYGSLDVEDLGRVYEALLELEPGIAEKTMCRLRRQKLEVVVPANQGERYQPKNKEIQKKGSKKTKVEWIEEISTGQFYLCVGLGRKASGSYYTPHSFVRFLVQETLGTQVAKRSPEDNPKPDEILKIKVIDPAMGSGHFLVEACRFLGEKLYEACRLCDELAIAAENRAEHMKKDHDIRNALKEAWEYRQRVYDLPDPDDELVSYLPSRSPEGFEAGISQIKAEALCRRLIAVHCLYGIDKNPLAVELAKLSIWIESHAEGMPLTFLDHRLIVGDALTGPFIENLTKYPGNQEIMDDLFNEGLHEKLQKALSNALTHVEDLEESIGVDISELESKETARKRFEDTIAPFKIIAAAWIGGVMIGTGGCDDDAYARLVEFYSEKGELPDLSNETNLRKMISIGLGTEEIFPNMTENLIKEELCIPAQPYELVYPEVFFPKGNIDRREGFDAVLGNPPWDRMLPADKEFFASYDFEILNASTKRERTDIQSRLLSNEFIRVLYDEYIENHRRAERAVKCLFSHQVVEIKGKKTIGKQDLFRVFMERNEQLLNDRGITGVLVPAAFHANEGATGVRKVYLEQMGLRHCYSFENRRRLFEIHAGFKFALIIASKAGPTKDFKCGFYLQDDNWIWKDISRRSLNYTLDFVRRTGGEYLGFPEVRSKKELEIVELCFKNGERFGEYCEHRNVKLGRELNMSDDEWRFTMADSLPLNNSDPRLPEVYEKFLKDEYLILHEGKTFWHFQDLWGDPPRFLVGLSKLADKTQLIQASRFFRLTFREVSASTNERTIVFTVLPPGTINSLTATNERPLIERPNYQILDLVSRCNTFSFDWIARLKVQTHVTLFLIKDFPIPSSVSSAFMSHCCLRLISNHEGFKPLWLEQLNEEWREKVPRFTWPVLNESRDRWELRAAIDAVVAASYGLQRSHYERVLAAFSHKSFPDAPDLCLGKFDELESIGIEAYIRKYDPYWDIPLNRDPPKPVLDISITEETKDEHQDDIWVDRGGQMSFVSPGPLFDSAKSTSGERRKK